MTRGYAVTAQYYDPLMAVAHAGMDQQIGTALAGLNVSLGPVVDVGAGTGLSTALIARTLPDAEILAVEPDPAMRPALMTRVWSDPDLRRRVSILPMTIGCAPLPPRIAAAVVSAALVHLTPADRAELWVRLAAHLDASGFALIEIQPTPEDNGEPNAFPEVAVGTVSYRGTASVNRLEGGRVRWRMTYTARSGSRILSEEEATFECWNVSAEQVVAEARLAGLRADVDGNLVRLVNADCLAT